MPRRSQSGVFNMDGLPGNVLLTTTVLRTLARSWMTLAGQLDRLDDSDHAMALCTRPKSEGKSYV